MLDDMLPTDPKEREAMLQRMSSRFIPAEKLSAPTEEDVQSIKRVRSRFFNADGSVNRELIDKKPQP